MTRRYRYSLMGVLLLLAGCGGGDRGPTEPAGPTESVWEVLPSSPTATGRHDDVFFLDPQMGWVASNDGHIYATAQGGDAWALLASLERVLPRTIGFVDEEHGWLGNLNFFSNPLPDSALFSTSDGGATWEDVTASIHGVKPVGICGIEVLDEKTISAVGRWNGPAVFVRSDDGGETWWSVDMAPLATGLVDVHFFDRDRGLAVGGRGVGNSATEQHSSRTVVLATNDGGHTWDERWVDENEGTWAWKITFPTPEVGFVSIQGPGGDGYVLRTRDSGRTWKKLQVTSGEGFSGIGFATPLVGWVAGSTVYRTLDGGENWMEAPFGEDVNRFRFLAPSIGYASGHRVYRLTELPEGVP